MKVIAEIGNTKYATLIRAGGNDYVADEGIVSGGEGLGMNPFELILSGLSSCTAITLRMYANRKGWMINKIVIKLTLLEGQLNTAAPTIIRREIHFAGELSEEIKTRLIEIANYCPVHKFLCKSTLIVTLLSE